MIMLGVVIDPDYHGEIGLLLHNELRKIMPGVQEILEGVSWC